MQRTGVMLVLLLILTLVYSQTSINPAGAPFFSPSLVHQSIHCCCRIGRVFGPPADLYERQIYRSSPYDYSDFYWGYAPENVGVISLKVNTTDCTDYLILMINFVEPLGDQSITFPCYGNGYFCDQSRDYTFNVPPGGVDANSFWAYYFRPSSSFYITIQEENYVRKDLKRASTCTYSIQAAREYECPAGTANVLTGEGPICQSYSNITSNGQTFTGVTSSADGNVYRLDVPENVTYVYAWVTSPDNAMVIMVAAGYGTLYSGEADYYAYNYGGTTLASNNSLYVYLVDYPNPTAGIPLFFSIQSTDGSQYSISFHWEYCGATKTGYGDNNPNYFAATMAYTVPPCNDPVTFTNMNLATKNYTFNLPAYNTSTSELGAAYGYLEVPFGTYGAAVNISFITTGENYLVFGKDQNCDCQGHNTGSISYGDQLSLISQDLYPGGYWTFGACNAENQTVTFTLVVEVWTAPSPSPVPSASPGQDSSTGILTPAVMLIVLASLYLL